MDIKKQLSNEFRNSILKLIISSELKYKSKNYKGAIDEKIEIKKLIEQQPEKQEAWNQFVDLIRASRSNNCNYDLIQDYKTKIDESKKKMIISMLEEKSHLRYKCGDYKGAIKAIRRAERYY